jgi:hypothetical protein
MRIFATIALAFLPIASSAAAPPAKPACDRFPPVHHAGALREAPPPSQRLDRLPPGDLHLTVERQVDGCREPVIVRYNIGGARP